MLFGSVWFLRSGLFADVSVEKSRFCRKGGFATLERRGLGAKAFGRQPFIN